MQLVQRAALRGNHVEAPVGLRSFERERLRWLSDHLAVRQDMRLPLVLKGQPRLVWLSSQRNRPCTIARPESLGGPSIARRSDARSHYLRLEGSTLSLDGFPGREYVSVSPTLDHS